MPHHWIPLDPQSPSSEERVGRLVLRLGKRMRYTGRASEDDRVWALLDLEEGEFERLVEDGLVPVDDPCSRRLEP